MNPASEILCSTEKAKIMKFALRLFNVKSVLVIGKFNSWAYNGWLSKCQLSKAANCRLGHDIVLYHLLAKLNLF